MTNNNNFAMKLLACALLYCVFSCQRVNADTTSLPEEEALTPWTCFREAPTLHVRRGTRTKITNHAIYETDEYCKAMVDVPGVKRKDLNVSVDTRRHTVKVAGTRKMGNEQDTEVSYQKILEIQDCLNVQDLVMWYSNGVVEITVPKAASSNKSKGHVPCLRGAVSSSVAFLREQHGQDEEDRGVLSRDILITNLHGDHVLPLKEEEEETMDETILSEILQTEMMGDHVSDIATAADDTEFEYWFNKM